MAFGTAIIYTFGALWLSFHLDIPVATGDKNAIALGVTPFMVGDALKMLIAGCLTPAVWSLTSRRG